MDTATRTNLLAEADALIALAAAEEIVLTRDDFRVSGGALTIDGMDAAEWVDAMTSE